MRTKVSVSLDGTGLSELDPRLIIQGVNEQAPGWNIAAASRFSRYGQRVTSTEKRYREVVIQFAIAEHRDILARESVLQKVRDWGRNGGWLEISYRPFERLHVICAAMPAVNGITKWAENYSLTFRAYGVPEWESKMPDSVEATGAGGTAALTILPSEGGPLRVEAVNSSGSACGTISFSANGQSMAFSNLAMASGETFLLDYDAENRQRIRIGSGGTWRSALDKRAGGSYDDILLPKGTHSITFASGVSLAWKFYVYGRWAG